jgi:hypothetical protein
MARPIDERTPARLLLVIALINLALLLGELAFNLLNAGVPW